MKKDQPYQCTVILELEKTIETLQAQVDVLKSAWDIAEHKSNLVDALHEIPGCFDGVIYANSPSVIPPLGCSHTMKFGNVARHNHGINIRYCTGVFK